MKDTKEVVLFFQRNANYDPIDIAKELKSRYEELGNPVILSVTSDPNKPVIYFKENPDFEIHASMSSVGFVINHTYFDKITSICFDIIDAFSEFNVECTRIGYISSIFLPSNKIEKIYERYLNKDNLNNISDFNIAWYSELKTDIGILNNWERFLTDHLDFSDLLCQYDFNTPVNEVINIDMKYLKKFFAICHEYMEKRIDI